MFEVTEDDSGLDIVWTGDLVMRYNFGREVGRPHWHPLRLPGSPALTWDAPPDHVHHHGMWLAWKKVNGVNFWEQPSGEDRTGFGRIEHRRLRDVAADGEAARFTAESDWVDWQGTLHLKDERRAVVYAPQEDRMAMGLELRLTAVEAVTLDVARGEPGDFGVFYSGLTVRFAEALEECRLLDSEGRREADDIYGSCAEWCGLSGRHADDGGTYGITIADSPDNPRHPTPWWVRNMPGYALIQPCICYNDPVELAAGELLELSYTVTLHKGQVGPGVGGK